MEFEIKQGMKRALWRKRFLSQEKRSLLSFNGLILFGGGLPLASQVDKGSSELFKFLLLPILFTFYVYLACRLGSFIRRLSRSYEEAGDESEVDQCLPGEERVTLFGRLKVADRTPLDGAPRFVLENTTNSQISEAPSVPIEVSLTPSSQQAEAMNDYVGKRLLIAGRIHFNALKGQPEVVPELLMELIP